MMRYGAMAVGGVLGLVVLKMMGALFLPVFGVVVGMLFFGLKVLFWLAIGYVVYRIFFHKRRDPAEV